MGAMGRRRCCLILGEIGGRLSPRWGSVFRECENPRLTPWAIVFRPSGPEGIAEGESWALGVLRQPPDVACYGWLETWNLELGTLLPQPPHVVCYGWEG